MRSSMLLALCAFTIVATIAGEPVPVPQDPAEEAWTAEIRTKLEKKVSFEFIDTPFDEGLSFLRALANITMVVEPKALELAKPISLRVTDTKIIDAINWITRTSRLQWTLKDRAIYIFMPRETLAEIEAREDAEKKQRGEQQRQHLEMQRLLSSARIQVKLPDGREIEADGLNPMSSVADQIMEQTINPAKDGLVVLRLQGNMHDLTDDDLLALIRKAAPKTTPEIDAKTRLLLVRSDDAISLRRVNALLRDLGLKRGGQMPAPGGMGPVQFEMRFNPGGPGNPPPGNPFGPPPGRGPQEPKKEKEPGVKGDF